MRLVEFIYTNKFDKLWYKLGLNENDKKELEDYMREFEQRKSIGIHTDDKNYLGDIIKKTGGAIKLRFSPSKSNKGKSGSYRTIYFLVKEGIYYFLLIYPKSQKDTLSDEEKKMVKKLIDQLKFSYNREN